MSGTPTSPRVVVVEDNPDLLDDVVFNLQQHGFDVAGTRDGRALDAHLGARGADVVVLDLGLPGEDGLSIAQRLRESHPFVGIVMLTARSGIDDRIRGHQQGADSYLCKPVHMEELAAVVRSLARRLAPLSARAAAPAWKIERRALRLHTPAGEAIELTGMECTVLAAVAAAPRQHASRRVLIEALGEDPMLFDERRLESCVSRLRRKLAARLPAGAPSLKAMRGDGYSLALPMRVFD